MVEIVDLLSDPELDSDSFSFNFSITVGVKVSNEGGEVEFDFNLHNIVVFLLGKCELLDSPYDFEFKFLLECNNMNFSVFLK